MEWHWVSNHPEETRCLGRVIGELVHGGEIICLEGDLGAGKTLLAQGIAEGLAVDGYVSSPTFTIVCEYEGRLPLYHMDLYRLDDPEMLADIGFEEYLTSDGVTVIEWAGKAGPLFPTEYLLIQIDQAIADEAEKRNFSVIGVGPKHIRLLKGLMVYADTRDGYCNPDGQHWVD
jgi:tRNA threonylcarbamoyladenosine biosynthesis protein TsaE